MSFGWYLYYCASYGAVGGLLGWLLGRIFRIENQTLLTAGIQGLVLGIALAVILVLVDLVFNASRWERFLAVPIGAFVGAVGGLLGGLVGQAFYGWTQWSLFLLFGWTLTGVLIGTAPGLYGVVYAMAQGEEAVGPRRKLVNGVLGGSLGGFLGGLLFLALLRGFALLLGDQADDLASPSLLGFLVLGLCIGLLIGLAQVILREAWVTVEAGFRAGRQLILSSAETTIGRQEGCDIALFGDNTVQKQHARIRSEKGRYVLENLDPASITYVNNREMKNPQILRDGDRIQIGKAVLRFNEKAKPAAPSR
ncbi:MAG: FHA domain-containing protein [Gemmataceae bacterium]